MPHQVHTPALHAREGWPRCISSVGSLPFSLLSGSNPRKQQETGGQGIYFHTLHATAFSLQAGPFTQGPQQNLCSLYSAATLAPAPNPSRPFRPRSGKCSLMSLEPTFFHKPAHTSQTIPLLNYPQYPQFLRGAKTDNLTKVMLPQNWLSLSLREYILLPPTHKANIILHKCFDQVKFQMMPLTSQISRIKAWNYFTPLPYSRVMERIIAQLRSCHLYMKTTPWSLTGLGQEPGPIASGGAEVCADLPPPPSLDLIPRNCHFS